MADAGKAAGGTGVDRRVALLQHMLRARLDVVGPERSLQSSYGFHYPFAGKLWSLQSGEEVGQLDAMAGLGLFERTFHDRIHVCNTCSHFALNFREVCPNCRNPNVEIVDMIHHYRCGFNAPESEYQRGNQLICPKCENALRHIGVDYERPATSYVCRTCTNLFSEPEIDSVCLKCGANVAAARLSTRNIYEYRITAKGVLVAGKGSIEGTEDAGVFDGDLGVYRISYFIQRLEQEIAGATRYKRPLVVIGAAIDQIRQMRAKFGDDRVARRLKELADLGRESLRESDSAAFNADSTLLVMLTDTPVEGAYVVAERLRQGLVERPSSSGLPNCTISIGLTSLNVDQPLAREEIISRLEQNIELARQSGGNTIWPRRS